MERDGGIEPPTLAWKAKVIPFYESRKILGAPRQNRTAITGLQNQCTAIVLVGLKFGSPAWDRTTDTLINSQVQLPLCYWGIKLGGATETRTQNPDYAERQISNLL